MAKVRFRDKEFEANNKEYLIPCVYDYARNSDDELYDLIMNHKVSLYLNDEIVDIDNWCITEVCETDEIFVTPLIAGGNGGFLQVMLGAVLIAASFITFLAPISGYMIAMGVSMMLGGVSSLLFQPTLPQISGSDMSSSQTYSWSGMKTTAQTDSPIPIVYGTHMVAGNVISIYTESHGGDNYLNMLLALCEGEIEGICTKEDVTSVCDTSYNVTNPYILLDDQFISVYNNTTWWYRTGTNLATSGVTAWNSWSTYSIGDGVTRNNLKYICTVSNSNKEPGVYSNWENYWTIFSHYPYSQNIIPYFTDSIMQYDDDRDITSDNYIQYTTTKDVDRVILQLKNPGLYEASEETGKIMEYTVYCTIDYKKSIGGSWTVLYVKTWDSNVTGGIKDDGTTTNSELIDISFFKHTNVSGVQPPTITIEITSNSFEDFTECSNETEKSYKIYYTVFDSNSNILEQSYVTNKIVRNKWWRTTYYNESGSGVNLPGDCPPMHHEYTKFYFNQYEIELSHEVTAGDKFEISATESSNSNIISINGRNKGELWTSIELNFIEMGLGQDTYDIRLKRPSSTPGPSDSFYISDKFILNSVTEVVEGKFIFPNTALLGLRIKANEQLSGAPPNIKVLLKGMKIQVPDIESSSPSGTDYTFHDCYWNESNDRWETYAGSELYWNNTNSWRTEYANNAILCVRDYMLNTRYGLGKYITSTDLYTTGVADSIKNCHEKYNPYGSSMDALSWWDGTSSVTWNDSWSLSRKASTITVTPNSSTRKITVSAVSDRLASVMLYLKTVAPLELDQSYTFKVTIANISGTISDIRFFYKDGSIGEGLSLLGTKNTITSNGTQEVSFTSHVSSSTLLLDFRFRNSITSFDITDISVETSSTYHYHTYNGVMDSPQSANTALSEMCNSFRCWPVWYSGKFNFIMNKDETPVHTLTVGNLTEFSQSFTPLSEIPNRIIGQFTNRNNNYNMRSLFAKSAFSDLNELNEVTIGLKGITNIKKAEREIKFRLNEVTNCTHNITAKCRLDYIHATAGDVIRLQDDVVTNWGQGGRVLDYTSTHIVIDKEYEFSNVATNTFIINYQKSDNSFVNASVDTTNINNDDALMTIPVESLNGNPATDAVYGIGVSDSSLKEFRLLSVTRSGVDEITIAGREHLPALYTEPDISIIDDTWEPPLNLYGIPGAPTKCSVIPTQSINGLGFILKAFGPSDGLAVKEIVVQMRTETSSYNTIAILPDGQNEATYVDDNLIIGSTYIFRFFCRTEYKSGVSNAYITSVVLNPTGSTIPAPTGIYIKGADPNDVDDEGRHYYADKDINLAWNSVDKIIIGYAIDIYHTEVSTANLLRTTTVGSAEYTYYFDSNVEDSGGNAHSNIIFVFRTISENSLKSVDSTIFNTINKDPSIPTGLTATSTIGGVQFTWDKNDEIDFKNYKVSTKVGTASFSEYSDIMDTSYQKSLIQSDIDSHGTKALIEAKVQVADLFNQTSVAASDVSANANTISDNTFQISGTTSGTFGIIYKLYDGDLTATAITIP